MCTITSQSYSKQVLLSGHVGWISGGTDFVQSGTVSFQVNRSGGGGGNHFLRQIIYFETDLMLICLGSNHLKNISTEIVIVFVFLIVLIAVTCFGWILPSLRNNTSS